MNTRQLSRALWTICKIVGPTGGVTVGTELGVAFGAAGGAGSGVLATDKILSEDQIH